MEGYIFHNNLDFALKYNYNSVESKNSYIRDKHCMTINGSCGVFLFAFYNQHTFPLSSVSLAESNRDINAFSYGFISPLYSYQLLYLWKV